MWLYLWVFPWRPAYIAEPHWGHNYAEARTSHYAGDTLQPRWPRQPQRPSIRVVLVVTHTTVAYMQVNISGLHQPNMVAYLGRLLTSGEVNSISDPESAR